MKKLLFVLIAVCILAVPVMAQNPVQDELTNLSNQQLLIVYDALVAEIQKRGVDTSAQNIRDTNIVFGRDVHIQTGQLTNCLPTPVPVNNGVVQLPIAPTATPIAQSGNKCSYDSQSPVDGTHVQRGQAFDIIWYMLNSGTTTWTTDYSIRFFSNTNFTKPGKDRYFLEAPVAPNTVGKCAIDAVAPSAPGTYAMAVVLGDEKDENFCVMTMEIIVD